MKRIFSVIVLILAIAVIILSSVAAFSQQISKQNKPVFDTLVGSVQKSYYFYGDFKLSLSQGLIVSDLLRFQIVDGDTLKSDIVQVASPISDSISLQYLKSVYDQKYMAILSEYMKTSIKKDSSEMKIKPKK